MNERIKELIRTKSTILFPGTDVVDCTITDIEKFAELIVLEMCKELDKAQWDKGEDWVCADGTRIIPQIKQHFGVEE